MKICITSQGKDLEADVDPRFGRCRFFIIIDPESMEFEAIENPISQSGGGAGIQSAQLVSDKGAEVILTGSVGPNAFRTLEASGVEVVTRVKGSVKDCVERFKKGELQASQAPNVPGHFGMGGGAAGKGGGREGNGKNERS